MTQRGPENLSLTALTAENQRRVDAASKGLLGVVANAIDSLTTPVPETLLVAHGRAIEQVRDGILGFVDSDIEQIVVRPRVPRSQDNVIFLPGQHQGIAIQCVTKDGDVGRMNLYGGLRDGEHGTYELRDTDRWMRWSHATRTDEIVSQPTSLNFHILNRQGRGVWTDLWLTYRLNRDFTLARWNFAGRNIGFDSQLQSGDHCFDGINKAFKSNSGVLLSLIPSV